MWYFIYFVIFLILIIIFFIGYKLYKKGGDSWIRGYIRYEFNKRRYIKKEPPKPIHIIFLIVDHFEPKWQTPTKEEEHNRIMSWIEKFPKIASKHLDGDGKHPQYTWFYPFHEYSVDNLQNLSKLCYEGFGEIELHLHHLDNTHTGLEEKLNRAKELFSSHGALITCEKEPKKIYGFIHGMFALDNSIPKYCGINNELQILNTTGCYADFTMPALNRAQSIKINSIYYAIDEPNRPKSYNKGIDVEVGKEPTGDLMIIQGPLIINFKNWQHIFYPQIDTGMITKDFLPTKQRIDLWIKCNIHVIGKPEWIFVKAFTHGAQPQNIHILLGNALDNIYSYLEEKYNDGINFQLHYVTAREAYNIIKAAENQMEGSPNQYRDYLIKPYANTKINSNLLYQLVSYQTDKIILKLDGKSYPEAKFEFKDKLILKSEQKYEDNLFIYHCKPK